MERLCNLEAKAFGLDVTRMLGTSSLSCLVEARGLVLAAIESFVTAGAERASGRNCVAARLNIVESIKVTSPFAGVLGLWTSKSFDALNRLFDRSSIGCWVSSTIWREALDIAKAFGLIVMST